MIYVINRPELLALEFYKSRPFKGSDKGIRYMIQKDVVEIEPEGEKIKSSAITVALAFATFENVCYLIQNGADRFFFIFFRGFGTGAMHVLCGLIVGGGLAYTWRRTDRKSVV